MLQELNNFLKKAGVSMPYRNINSSSVTKKEKLAYPKILQLGSKKDRVWVTFQSGENKAEIKEAHLLYTLNPKEFDKTRGHREEWLQAPAKIGNGRCESIMPPGATHAIFCMRDTNGFLITSEPLPDFQKVPYATTQDSTFLKNGYAYKPGLFSLIELAKKAQSIAENKRVDVSALKKSLSTAQLLYDSEKIVVKQLSNAIRSLRSEIRKLKTVPQSKHFTINRFPSEPLF